MCYSVWLSSKKTIAGLFILRRVFFKRHWFITAFSLNGWTMSSEASSACCLSIQWPLRTILMNCDCRWTGVNKEIGRGFQSSDIAHPLKTFRKHSTAHYARSAGESCGQRMLMAGNYCSVAERAQTYHSAVSPQLAASSMSDRLRSVSEARRNRRWSVTWH